MPAASKISWLWACETPPTPSDEHIFTQNINKQFFKKYNFYQDFTFAF